MKTLAKLILFVILLALPSGGRWLSYYRGTYQPPEIAAVESSRITLPEMTYNTFDEMPRQGNGQVLLDLAHGNNLAIDDLTPLREKLSARGVNVETFTGYEDDLSNALRGATALVVAAPTYAFSDLERQAIRDFVQDGGRLLLAADPTRSIVLEDEYGYVDLFSLLYPISAIPAINSLANDFGIAFYEDYLYTLSGYQGNYRNVPYDFQDGRVVLFAAHSIASDGEALLTGGEEVLSNLRTGQTRLTPAVFAPEDAVLALGDVNILISPYHQVADNDGFLSYIADWLAVDTRSRDLMDFPYLFDGPVDLVQTVDEVLPSGAIEQVTLIQDIFKQGNISATLSITITPGHDTLLLSTFDQIQAVETILQHAGITITLGMPTATEDDDAVRSEPSEPTDAAGDEEVDAPQRDTITLEALGTFTLQGLTLFVVDDNQGGGILILLAEDVAALEEASFRLFSGDFGDCLTHDGGSQRTGGLQQTAVTLCPGQNAETWEDFNEESDLPEWDAGEDDGGEDIIIPETPTPLPPEDNGLQRLLIVSIDVGGGGTGSGADEFANVLSGLYEITTWSTSEQGYPTGDDLNGYDAYILAFGDTPFPDDDLDRTLLIGEITGPVLLIGSQPLPPYLFNDAPAMIADLEIVNDTHPLAFGYLEGDVIDLLPAEVDTPSLVLDTEEIATEDESAIVFVRGSSSANPGSPAVVATENSSGQRIAIAVFPFQRLPYEAQFIFALNVTYWLLEGY